MALPLKQREHQIEFFTTEIKKRYGSDRGYIQAAAKDLGVNYTQFSSIVRGVLPPTAKLMKHLGYIPLEASTPLGMTYGGKSMRGGEYSVFEVELSREGSDIRKKLLEWGDYEHWNWSEQEARILSRAVYSALCDIFANPGKWDVIFKPKSQRQLDAEKAWAAHEASFAEKEKALLAAGHESDMAGDNIANLFEGME